MGVRMFAAIGVACLVCGCFRQPPVKVVDLSVGKLPPGTAMNLEGGVADPVWRRAATMPFEKTGETRFLWDGERLYGSVGKWEQRFALHPDEQICVEIRFDGRVVKLFFDEAPGHADGLPVFALREAWSIDRGQDGRRTPLAAGLCEVRGGGQPTKRGYSWSLRFSLAWSALGVTSPGDQRVGVQVYRLVPQRSVGHVAEMGNLRDKH